MGYFVGSINKIFKPKDGNNMAIFYDGVYKSSDDIDIEYKSSGMDEIDYIDYIEKKMKDSIKKDMEYIQSSKNPRYEITIDEGFITINYLQYDYTQFFEIDEIYMITNTESFIDINLKHSSSSIRLNYSEEEYGDYIKSQKLKVEHSNTLKLLMCELKNRRNNLKKSLTF